MDVNNIITNDGVQELPLYLLDLEELDSLRLTTLNIFLRQLSINNGNLNGSKMVSMNSSILQAVDKKYKTAIAFLLEHGALHTIKKYVPGKFSMRYFLSIDAVKQILGSLTTNEINAYMKLRYGRVSTFFVRNPKLNRVFATELSSEDICSIIGALK